IEAEITRQALSQKPALPAVTASPTRKKPAATPQKLSPLMKLFNKITDQQKLENFLRSLNNATEKDQETFYSELFRLSAQSEQSTHATAADIPLFIQTLAAAEAMPFESPAEVNSTINGPIQLLFQYLKQVPPTNPPPAAQKLFNRLIALKNYCIKWTRQDSTLSELQPKDEYEYTSKQNHKYHVSEEFLNMLNRGGNLIWVNNAITMPDYRNVHTMDYSIIYNQTKDSVEQLINALEKAGASPENIRKLLTSGIFLDIIHDSYNQYAMRSNMGLSTNTICQRLNLQVKGKNIFLKKESFISIREFEQIITLKQAVITWNTEQDTVQAQIQPLSHLLETPTSSGFAYRYLQPLFCGGQKEILTLQKHPCSKDYLILLAEKLKDPDFKTAFFNDLREKSFIEKDQETRGQLANLIQKIQENQTAWSSDDPKLTDIFSELAQELTQLQNSLPPLENPPADPAT
ncbi:MAG: hypothetical protein WC371_03020, partial [Parachlamydiales bacterium]